MTPFNLTFKMTALILLNGDGGAFDDVADDLFGLFGLLHGGRVTGVYDNAVGEGGDGELFEVVGDAEGTAIEEGHRLRGAVEHE